MNGILRWLLALAGTAAVCLLLMAYVDLPVGRLFDGGRDYVPGGFAVGTEPFIALLDIIGLVYAVRARRRHSLSQNGLAIILAALACTLAYVLTALVLKPVFGRLPVAQAVQLSDWQTAFVLLHGSEHSIFPSGHTAVLASILSIFWFSWPAYRAWYGVALLALCLFLVAGNWHFLSDVIAGAFLGASCGLAVRAGWEVLTRRSQTSNLRN